MVSPRPRSGRDPQEAAKRKEAVEKLKLKKKVPGKAPSDESRAAIRKAAQEKIEAARKDKAGPKRVPREEMIGNRKKPESANKPVGRPVIKPEKKPADPNQTPKTNDYIITERAENFGIYPNQPAVIPPDKPIIIAGYAPQKQGPVPPMQKQGPVPPMQKQGPVSPMQMMQGMGQASPSMAQPGPAQRANAQQLQARAQQLQARLNAARGQGGQPRFR
jgi:hypothetical protein